MATSWEKEGNDIRSAFKAAMDTSLPSVTVAYDNAPFSIPTNGSKWVRLSVLSGGSNRAALDAANPRYRHVGIVKAQIFVKPNRGDSEIRQIAETISTIFRGVAIGDCQFRDPSIDVMGQENGWYQWNVSTPFYRDETF